MAPYFKRRMVQQRHSEYSGINESPGQDSAPRRDSRTTFAEVKTEE